MLLYITWKKDGKRKQGTWKKNEKRETRLNITRQTFQPISSDVDEENIRIFRTDGYQVRVVAQKKNAILSYL